MKARATLGGLLVAGTAVLVGQYSADAVPGGRNDGGVAGGIGADVIVGALPDIAKFGTVNGVTAYAIATTSCNIGDEILLWYSNNNDHPVIAQNLYRLKDGRFEQIGMSWLKHGFCALQQTLCGPCTPAGGGCPPLLGIGCSDPYSSGLNGQQSNLGPRSQVNAATGYFPYPWTAPAAPQTTGRRIQVANTDLNPSMNPGAQFYAEGMYVSAQDSATGNSGNNASYRRFTVGSLSGGGYNLSTTGPTIQQKPAIYAWQAAMQSVELRTLDIDGDGRFIVGFNVTENGDGTYRYEYAIYNHTSDLCGSSLSIPKAAGASITNVGFKDIHHHSGEPYDTTDWTAEVSKGAITWSVGTTYAADPDANALRWSTLYNFWFDSDTPPAACEVTLGLFKNDGSATFAGAIPAGTPPIAGDIDGNGIVNGADLAAVLAYWGTPQGDIDGDGTTNGSDLAILLGNWG